MLWSRVGKQRDQKAAIASSQRVGWPRHKKARRKGRIIVFIDESDLSTWPHRVRTRAPRERTHILRQTFNWNKLSVIARLTLWQY
jgi:hypothetical protein